MNNRTDSHSPKGASIEKSEKEGIETVRNLATLSNNGEQKERERERESINEHVI